jgi:TRAP-type C4-dicarboxylate transport system permease small subunit
VVVTTLPSQGEWRMDETPVGRLVLALASGLAIAGGVSLAAVTVITVLSVIGRALIPIGLAPVPGDVELVQAGILFAVFVFLPWCHLERGHAIVAVLTDRFPVRFSAIAEFIWDVVMVVVAAFIAWRLWIGLTDKYGNLESTFILRLPLWIVYSGGFIGAVMFVIAAVYCAARSGSNAFSPRPARPVSGAGE